MDFMSLICALGIIAFLRPAVSVPGEGCPEPYGAEELDGTVECLYKSTHRLSWAAARKECKDKKGELATIYTWSKFMILMRGKDTIWLGLYRDNEHHPFKWIGQDKQLEPAFARQIFLNGQPDNWGGREYCAVLDRVRGGVNDMPCHFPVRFVCQMESNNKT